MRKELEPKDWMERIWHGLEFRAKFGSKTWADCEICSITNTRQFAWSNIIMSAGDALMSALAIERRHFDPPGNGLQIQMLQAYRVRG